MHSPTETGLPLRIRNLPQRGALLLIRGYQRFISPLSGRHCRFYPSCSCYAHTAIAQYGCLRGGWMALRRLARCHPFSEGGIDPVPESTHSREVPGSNGYQA